MDWMKDLLKGVVDEEEKLNPIIENVKKEFPKYAVPKSEFNSVNSELKEVKGKLVESSALIEELKTKAGMTDEFKTKAVEWETKYKEFEAQTEERIKTVVKKSGVKDLLSGKMTKSAVDLVLDKIDYSGIELDGQKIKDDAKLLEKLKADYEDLFIVENKDSKHKDGNKENKSKDDDTALRKAMGLL